MTNLLQCATFLGITHKFLDSLFASSKKKIKKEEEALFACVDSTGYNMENYTTRYKKTKTTQSLQNNDLVECFVSILDMIDEILILSLN